MSLQDNPVAKTQMLIRRPVAEVFEAFIDPAITKKFWFTKSSGRLEHGASITWEWEMYGAVGHVHVKKIEKNKRILVEWDDPSTSVEWSFESRSEQSTLVSIANWGFHGDDAQVAAQAMDSMGGFAYVLAGLKAYLEYGIELNLIADQHPDAAIERTKLEQPTLEQLTVDQAHHSHLGALIVDCQTDDLQEDAEFWSAALGRTAESTAKQVNPKYIRLEGDPSTLPVLLQQVEHPSRIHIDIEADDIPAEVKRLETLGAVVVSQMPKWTVMEAPSGHRFCVIGPIRKDFAKNATTWG